MGPFSTPVTPHGLCHVSKFLRYTHSATYCYKSVVTFEDRSRIIKSSDILFQVWHVCTRGTMVFYGHNFGTVRSLKT